MTGDEALAHLIAALEDIERLLPDDKASWDCDPVLRLAVERLWITAGNTAEEYRRTAGADPGVEPWAELAAYRNRPAHVGSSAIRWCTSGARNSGFRRVTAVSYGHTTPQVRGPFRGISAGSRTRRKSSTSQAVAK